MLEPVYWFLVLLLRRMYLAVVAFIIYYKCSINYNDPFSGKHILKKKRSSKYFVTSNKKRNFLYSTVSSTSDKKCCTLFALLGRSVHSDTNFSGKHSSHAAITRND